jgi:hypothetical protein
MGRGDSTINRCSNRKILSRNVSCSGVYDSVETRCSTLADYPDRDYGVAFEAPAFALEHIFRLKDSRDIYMFRHLLTFLVYFGGVFAVYRLAHQRFLDWRTGLLSGTLSYTDTALLCGVILKFQGHSVYGGFCCCHEYNNLIRAATTG